jgi:hypothetical protein
MITTLARVLWSVTFQPWECKIATTIKMLGKNGTVVIFTAITMASGIIGILRISKSQ